MALYWAPEPHDPLAQAGSVWLGRDAELAIDLPQPPLPGLHQATQAPRLYGFHATLRPPMRLATGWEEFIAAAHAVAAAIAPFPMPALAVTDLDGFLALQPCAPCPALHRLADACVTGTDGHRLRADAAELARRRAAGLTPAQDALLRRWGYPYVLAEWRFHMTLSRRLLPTEMSILQPAAAAHFAAALPGARHVRAITVFCQRDGGPFLMAERLPLRG